MLEKVKIILTVILSVILSIPNESVEAAMIEKTNLSERPRVSDNFDPELAPVELNFLLVIRSKEFKYLPGKEGQLVTEDNWQDLISITSAGLLEIENAWKVYNDPTEKGLAGIFPGVKRKVIQFIYQPQTINHFVKYSGTERQSYIDRMTTFFESTDSQAHFILDFGQDSYRTAFFLGGNYATTADSRNGGHQKNFIILSIDSELTGIHEYSHGLNGLLQDNIASLTAEYAFQLDQEKWDDEDWACMPYFRQLAKKFKYVELDWLTKVSRTTGLSHIFLDVEPLETFPKALGITHITADGLYSMAYYDKSGNKINWSQAQDEMQAFTVLNGMPTSTIIEYSYSRRRATSGPEYWEYYQSYKLINYLESLLCWFDGKPKGSILPYTQKRIDNGMKLLHPELVNQ